MTLHFWKFLLLCCDCATNGSTFKTTIIFHIIHSSISPNFLGLGEDMLVTTIPLNYYTTSLMLHQVMEKPLEKKAGKNFGPPGTKKMIYFIDDMNMPEVDTYGTVQPHTLIRQVDVCVV